MYIKNNRSSVFTLLSQPHRFITGVSKYQLRTVSTLSLRLHKMRFIVKSDVTTRKYFIWKRFNRFILLIYDYLILE